MRIKRIEPLHWLVKSVEIAFIGSLHPPVPWIPCSRAMAACRRFSIRRSHSHVKTDRPATLATFAGVPLAIGIHPTRSQVIAVSSTRPYGNRPPSPTQAKRSVAARQTPGKPVAMAQIPAFAAVEANVGEDRFVSRAAAPRPGCWPLAVDRGRNARVRRDDHRTPAFDRAKYPAGQVLLQLARAPEPAVVGHVDQDLRLVALPAASATNWFRITWGNTVS